MNELIKVRAFFGTHPIYESLVKFPPKNVKFLGTPNLESYESLKIYSKTRRQIKDKLKQLLHKIGLPRMIWLPSLNSDLIHSSRGFLVLNKKPWVVDIEHIGSFGEFRKTRVKLLAFKFLRSHYCKFILPHCKASMYSFFNAWNPPKDLKKKTEVVYPAIEPRKMLKEKHEKIRIGFLATRGAFYEKGGGELFEAFKVLSRKYDVELWVKSKVPPEIKIQTRKIGSIKVIEKSYPTREDLFKEFYEKIDIFCLPTYVDSFGYAILEAASVGLPIVATDIFAIPEIVANYKGGFLITTPISDFKNFIPGWFDRNFIKEKNKTVITQLVEKLSILIEDPSLSKKMGKYNKQLVENGKFSIKERNKKLKRIYEEALRY